jgi:hypothetical protein
VLARRIQRAAHELAPAASAAPGAEAATEEVVDLSSGCGHHIIIVTVALAPGGPGLKKK